MEREGKEKYNRQSIKHLQYTLKICLIARNLLNGLKTCWEVFQYMTCSENRLACQAGDAANSLEGYSKFDFNGAMGSNEVRRRSRFLRRRGRVRRLKYSWKSTAYHSIRKRITERKDQPCRQYNPCNCQTACGKQCACLLNGTCCEKYCGCPKTCKNRFRGCHCAKSQCRSRQCPCFAADRECDPDVCRNCWVSCGDGSLGVPNQRGDNYECRNMKLLLKQQQRVLLGRSDVSGWGAFLKNSVGKHEYLGEYTGELISHREADKRGKIYDRENSSFLFNLNDQFVLDAYRKGDKLKFANHSPDPNCYAKVIMVAGDHRVGIFAKERISAGEELFYDYRYEPDRAPAWARKPEASGSKKEDGAHTSGRAKKVA
ncbi:enhancer of zeste, ezh, putative [Ricinus communis]|uniref:Enhancer of zeste, ezh, putative n=1 Tax=Ricinus communis TaxID=3988 RepID=B9SCA4_RICCO|nr:enhancer of zeste, ezh, putative [Ricinus communis]